MAGDQHFTRVDLVEAKNRIAKKLGAGKAEKYFNLITRFFSKKLNKSDFNKLCIVAVGRENISLHNWFIRSILKNASLSTMPSKGELSANGEVANGYRASCLQSLYRDNLLPKTPRRGRTPTLYDRKCRDRPSPLGPHGKPQTVVCREPAPKVVEQQSATELHSLGSGPISVISVRDGEEADQTAGRPGSYCKTPLTAPYGVQIRAKGTHKVLSALQSSSAPMESCYSKGELPDTGSLMMRLQQKLEAEGLNVSLDYANLLNISLNMHLKRLIQPCVELARSGVRNQQHVGVRVQAVPGMNGMMQKVRYVQRPTSYTCASWVDLRAAVELNATVLGENWPLHLETVALQQDWQVGAGTSHLGGDVSGLLI